jgi:hypothetical protein
LLYFRLFASKIRKHEEATQSNFAVLSCSQIIGFEAKKREYEWRRLATIDMRIWKMKVLAIFGK